MTSSDLPGLISTFFQQVLKTARSNIEFALASSGWASFDSTEQINDQHQKYKQINFSRRNLLDGNDVFGVWSCSGCKDSNLIMLGRLDLITVHAPFVPETETPRDNQHYSSVPASIVGLGLELVPIGNINQPDLNFNSGAIISSLSSPKDDIQDFFSVEAVDDYQSQKEILLPSTITNNNCQIHENTDYIYAVSAFSFCMGVFATILFILLKNIISKVRNNAIITSIYKLEKKMINNLKKQNYDQVINILNSQLPSIMEQKIATQFQVACLKHLLAKAYLFQQKVGLAEVLLLEAKTIYEVDIRKKTYFSNVLEDLGNAFHSQFQFDKALESYTMALDIHVEQSKLKKMQGISEKCSLDTSSNSSFFPSFFEKDNCDNEMASPVYIPPRSFASPYKAKEMRRSSSYSSRDINTYSETNMVQSFNEMLETEAQLADLDTSIDDDSTTLLPESSSYEEAMTAVYATTTSTVEVLATIDTARLHHLIANVLADKGHFGPALEYYSVALDMYSELNASSHLSDLIKSAMARCSEFKGMGSPERQ